MYVVQSIYIVIRRSQCFSLQRKDVRIFDLGMSLPECAGLDCGHVYTKICSKHKFECVWKDKKTERLGFKPQAP